MTPSVSESTPQRRAAFLVFCCTLCGAAAQVLIKLGSARLKLDLPLPDLLLNLLGNTPLIGGLAIYGVSTVLLVLALQHGELSMLYPVIALTFIWVTILASFVFHEPMNAWKLAGIALIVIGVGILGAGGRR